MTQGPGKRPQRRYTPRNKYGVFGTRKALRIYLLITLGWFVIVSVIAAILHVLGIPLPNLMAH